MVTTANRETFFLVNLVFKQQKRTCIDYVDFFIWVFVKFKFGNTTFLQINLTKCKLLQCIFNNYLALS